ncbi:MAG: hypothetical protein O2780_12450 [Proteobacteria bacterium]|nr:hypothetical protein [Pseudomonadota bacterium]
MAAKIGSLIADLGMNTAEFKAGIKRAQSLTTTFQKSASSAFNRINNSVAGLGGQIAALAGAGSLIMLAKNALDTADEMEKLNRRLGVSTESLSQMKFAAEQSGIGFNVLTMGMQRAQRRIAEAAVGTGEAQTALLELGISAEKLAAAKPDQQLMHIADAMQGVTDSGDRTRLAMKLFDSEGVAMLQMMDKGADGMRDLMVEADSLGLTLSHKAAVGAAEANDALNIARSAMLGMAQEAATNFAPAMQSIATNLAETVPKAAAMSVKAFNSLRAEGLQVLSLLTNKYAALKYMVAQALKAIGLDEMAAKEFSGAGFLERFSAELLTSAEAAKIATAEIKAVVNTVSTIPTEPLDSVASGFGRMSFEAAQSQLKIKDLGDSIKIDIGDNSRNVFQQMRDSFASAINAMVNQYINSGLTNLFSGPLGADGKRSGGLVSKLLNLFGGGKAAGGPVSVNTPYMVGEKGPEMFVPRQNGTIIPNGGGGGSVSITQYNDFSGRGPMDIAQMQGVLAANNAQLKAEIFDRMRRGR